MSVHINEWPGTPLSAEDFKEGRVLVVEYRANAKYAWDAGVAIGRYLRELKEGRLIARRCRRCGRVAIPPRMFCEECFRPTDDWVYVRDTGTVNTFSICYVRWDTARIKEPQIPAVIEIDGASKGMGIMHLLGGVQPEQVRVGMRVKAVWKPPHQRNGAITDILYFQPEGV